MDKYTYCIANSWIDANKGQRHVYVRFLERLTYTQFDIFKRILQEMRNLSKDNPEHTSHDIVFDALERFAMEWNIYGVIVDGCDGLILY